MKSNQERGFTIIEALVVLIVGGILIAATVNLYIKFSIIHRRSNE